MKRLIDVVAAACGLAVTAPLFVVIAAAIAATSPGPVFFRQQRIGRGFRPFTLYKFRTMAAGAELGAPITADGDRRVTGVGRWLRKSKLDELPQLFNVLKGDMSLVGPRPEVRRFVEMFRADFEDILAVRPGITDFASLEYRYEEETLAGFEDPEASYIAVVLPHKIVLCRRYLRERGALTDLRILLLTLTALVRLPADGRVRAAGKTK
jgi:lipopolysaccharide/colanic/teichoic acid biosynthesis glycosyltransferase